SRREVAAPAPKRKGAQGGDDELVARQGIAVPEEMIVWVLEVEEVRERRLQRVVGVEGEGAELALRLDLERVVVGGAVVLDQGRADELRIGTPGLREGNQAGARLVHVERVVEPAAARPDVGEPHAQIANLSLHADIELVDRAVLRAKREPTDVLRRDPGRRQARRERVWEGKERPAVLHRIVVGLGDLERPAALEPVEVTDLLGEGAVTAPRHRVTREAVCDAEPRAEVPEIRV